MVGGEDVFAPEPGFFAVRFVNARMGNCLCLHVECVVLRLSDKTYLVTA